jgi:L-fuconolactonase
VTLRIDSHHHLWRFNPTEYDWIHDSISMLRRDFLPGELETEATRANVAGTVLVQARQTIEETDELLKIAEANPIIRGVVGWLPLASPDFLQQLKVFRSSKLLKGLRHVVQAEPPGFLEGADFNRGIDAMQGSGLTYDLLIHKEQMEESIAFVDRHPGQVFVLDHLAKPAVGRDLRVWATHLARLAERPNVFCKLSGLVTEADGYRWSPQSIAPYLDTALSCFGANRLMTGTDWPVCTVSCSYTQWWETIEAWSAPLSQTERDAILGRTAMKVYNLGETA